MDQVDALGPTVITTYFRAMLVTGTVVMTIMKVRASIWIQVDALGPTVITTHFRAMLVTALS